jgi:hypothetical protein
MEKRRTTEDRRTSDVMEFGTSDEQPSFVGAAPGDANVQVISGASMTSLPLGGLRIAQARDLVGTILNIDGDAAVLVNGEPARSTHRLGVGDTLEFVHHAGEKGAEAWRSQ